MDCALPQRWRGDDERIEDDDDWHIFGACASGRRECTSSCIAPENAKRFSAPIRVVPPNRRCSKRLVRVKRRKSTSAAVEEARLPLEKNCFQCSACVNFSSSDSAMCAKIGKTYFTFCSQECWQQWLPSTCAPMDNVKKSLGSSPDSVAAPFYCDTSDDRGSPLLRHGSSERVSCSAIPEHNCSGKLAMDELFDEVGNDVLLSEDAPNVLLELIRNRQSKMMTGRLRGVTL